MKTHLPWAVLTSFFFALAVAVHAAGPRDAQWREVEEAVRQRLPKTALEKLQPIIDGALADKAYPEAIKAIGEKISLETSLEGNRPEERIVRLQSELEKAPAPMKPVMNALLAHAYWQFYQTHRGLYFQRTPNAVSSSTDVRTWDLPRILAEIDKQFSAALANEALLKATPIASYDSLLEKGSAPDSYRPTLFDFLAYEALEFYQAGETAATRAEDEFEIEDSDPIFGTPSEFLNWQPDTKDTASPKYKAIRLYQALLKFHVSDSDRSAYDDADLARIFYGKNVAQGDNIPERYKAALRRFIEATADRAISARALAALASLLKDESDFTEAHTLAKRGFDRFPTTAGAALCGNVIAEIEERSLSLNTERVWNSPWPTLNVSYRNVEKIYFRAVPVEPLDSFGPSFVFDRLGHSRLAKLLAATPALSWDANLPATRDYKERTESLPVPTTLKPGLYAILASHAPDFHEKDNRLSIVHLWVSDLALIVQQRSDGNRNSGFVLNAVTGEPIDSAKVRFWKRSPANEYKEILGATTDTEGRFYIPNENSSLIILAEHEGQAISGGEEFWVYPGQRPKPDGVGILFFTDRAIYRPGQTISYKGISYRFDRDAAKYSVVSGKDVGVVFKDNNGKEIARSKLRTNDYGSFTGVFTAPRDRLTGRMSISVEGGPYASTYFDVEEYKRPKFQVELNAPNEAAKLDAPVPLTGKAAAYTGAAVGGAQVKWRVTRAVRLPEWCWWWQPPESKAIAHGTALTDPDGTFKITFPASADHSVPTKNEPTFEFSIHADITDSTGETRSADRTILAGYTALAASIKEDDWETPDKPVEFSIETQSLDGNPQPAKGTVTVYNVKQPAAVQRSSLQAAPSYRIHDSGEPNVDSSNPLSWELGDVLTTKEFATDATGKLRLPVSLPAGVFRALLATEDRFGRQVTARDTILVVNPNANHAAAKIPNVFLAQKWSVEPGETFSALWATGYDTGRAFIEIEQEGTMLKSYWTAANKTQEFIKLPINESMRGGLTVRTTYVRENRAYFEQRVINVPWSNKIFNVRWETFRSKLEPGQKEKWTAVVSGPSDKRAEAEMVATLYDASLDQFVNHRWSEGFPVFRNEQSRAYSHFANAETAFQNAADWHSAPYNDPHWSYRSFPLELTRQATGGMRGRGVGMVANAEEIGSIRLEAFSVNAASDAGYVAKSAAAPQRPEPSATAMGPVPNEATNPAPKPDLTKVVARKNLTETAFFFPKLRTNEKGLVEMAFTMPEALTEWKFLGFAHDKQLRSGFITSKAVTSKDLMVEPNPPRFAREGDLLEFTMKVSNQSDSAQSGTVKLTFADAATLASADAALGNRESEKTFDLPPKQSRSFSWKIAVPDGMSFLNYKAVAASARTSDGEEGFLPVLSRRVLLTESLPLQIRGKGTKEFEFKKLLESGSSRSLENQALTVQMVSQPAWYAVMALPYLIEFPYECSEQVFNRYYANVLARHIANSDPKIRRVFDLWKNTPALDSPLEKNQELKSVLLEETPWLRDANAESQARRNVGLLFDANRLDNESARALRMLKERQLSTGMWSWFAGGPVSEYISLYVVAGFGRLRHLGTDVDVQPALSALSALDGWMTENYHLIQKSYQPENYVPSYIDALYLYARSFYLPERPIAAADKEAVDFYLAHARNFWTKLDSRMSLGHLALALDRFGDKQTPAAIMKSLKERSSTSEELGMYWQDSRPSWWWYQSPIETQAMMIEAFSEVSKDAKAVEDCKVWLLKQKQTQDWKTTKATSDAVYALLLRGQNLLASDALVEVSLGGEAIKPKKTEAGTGFYEEKFSRGEIKPAQGHVTLKKSDDGVSWGSVYWHYLEDLSRVTPHEGTPLKLTKTLFVKETTSQGQVLKPVAGPVAVGDELVVRMELRTDRDMEFIHLKDQRGSGLEPVNVLSGYKFKNGLGYYESTRDTASHFFIDNLPRGTYVFDYSVRVQLRGKYQTGVAEIQCMYAPEFSSHSESMLLEVK